MPEAEFRLPLPSGGNISYGEAFSPFIIYAVRGHSECYILIPKQDQENLQGIIIVANEAGIRICQHKNWYNMFVYKVLQNVNCKDQSKFIKIDHCQIPTDVQGTIVDNLIKQIQYKSK